MNLKEYNHKNCEPQRGRKDIPASISMSTEKGLFTFNKPAAELINVCEKDKVVVYQDEEEPENWYIEVVKDRGFPVRYNKRWENYKFNNVKVARKIAESVCFSGKTGRMLIAKQPTKIGDRTLWGILTISLNNTNK